MMSVIVMALTLVIGLGALAYYLILTEGRKKSKRRIILTFDRYKMMRQLPENQLCADKWWASREALGVSELEFYRVLIDDWSRGRGGEEPPGSVQHRPYGYDNLIRFEDHNASEH